MPSPQQQSAQLALATVEPITLPGSKEQLLTMGILRLDKIHPVISGNKWFKLKYYLQEATAKQSQE